MADPFVLAHVRRLPLVARLNPQQLEWVADVTQILRYGPGEVMYRQGDVPPGLFMFISGSGTLIQRGSDGVDRPFGQVATNEFINENALFSPIPSPMTLTIAETSIVMFLGTQQFQSALAYHPDLKTAITPTTPIPAQAADAPAPAPTSQQPRTPSLAPIRENETVILQVRRHWWMVAGRAAWITIAAIILWAACIMLQSPIPQFPWVLVALVGTLALGFYALYTYIEWRNNLFVITDRRVISVKQNILTFNKEVNEIPLDGIHEIAVSLPPLMDFVGRILGYGTLIIRTSGDASNMVLNEVADPKSIQQTIFEQRQKFQSGQAQQQQNATRNAIKAEVNKFLVGSDGMSSSPSGSKTSTYTPPGLFSLKFINDKGETVYRKHHAVWTQHVLIPSMIVLAGIILLFVGVIGFFAPLLIIALGAVLIYLADWDWRNDLYIVGDQTITIIHKRPLFLQDQKDQVALAQVDNVVAEVRGFFNTLLQMGDVRLLLVGTEERNAKYFMQVYQPQEIQQEISRRQDHAEQVKREAEAVQQRQAIVQYLSVYHESVQGSQPTGPGTPQPPVPYANPAQPAAAPQPVYTTPPAAPYTPPAVTPTPTPYNNPTQPTPYISQPTIQSAPSISPPSSLPELPPRVRDRSRPPSVPRARPDDQSSPRQ